MKARLVLFVLIFSVLSCQHEHGDYVCPPCGMDCDQLSFAEKGFCPHCKMDLILKSDLEEEQNLVVNEVILKEGSGTFLIEGGALAEKTVQVYYHRPANLAKDTRVIFVLHGAGRGGRAYRDAWVEASEKYGLLVLTPQYSDENYPQFWNYNLAGMISDVDIQNETFSINHQSDRWLYEDFDRIFDEVKSTLGLTVENYDMFGHSAGGQLLHRMAIFKPESKADRILAANSGWYTLPDDTIAFPYGLSGLDSSILQPKIFTTNLVLFLGEKDDASETRGELRRSPEVDVQGLHRLARGKYFYSEAEKIAKRSGYEFHWQLHIVPEVGHDYVEMSSAAAKYLYGGR